LETASNRHSKTPRPPAPPADASVTRFEAAIAGTKAPAGSTAEFGDAPGVTMPNLAGETIRGVMHDCSRLGLVPSIIGDGIAIKQFPDAGSQVPRGSSVTVLLGAPGMLVPAAARRVSN
ncbi:MAG: PASTA domain-containing protein, partial [Acidobacteriota bacterium]|nr:PASTA domain-containing protein [Acidobacteriota bacterium]